MSQTILNLITEHPLSDGVYIKVQEVFDGAETPVRYRIHGHNLHETDVDSVMVVRDRVHETHRMHEENTTNYDGCEMDEWLNTTFANRLPEALRNCVLTAPILIRDADGQAAHTIARKFFLPSYSEWGYGALSGVSDGIAGPYTTTNEKRKVYNEGNTVVNTWLRSWYSSANYYCIGTNGYAGSYYAASGGYWALPAFDLPSSLMVASEPDEDGSYRVIYPDATELPGVDFKCRVAAGERRYASAKVDCEVTGYSEGALEFWLCNNYNDEEPTWETATLSNTHKFTNRGKTAEEWALGLRIKATGEQTVQAREPYAAFTCDKPEEV